MLTNDVFFLYAPGYCGNYLQWVINVSEKDSSDKVIRDPLLPDTTTHGFVRRPTHLSPNSLIIWLARNGPISPQTFIVNCFNDEGEFMQHAAYAASSIMRSRHRPRCMNIGAVDKDEIYVGALNTYSKWPVYFKATGVRRRPDWYDFDIDGAQESAVPNTKDRNWLYDNWRHKFPINVGFDWRAFDSLMRANRDWYDTRHAHTPWEVNESEYNVYDTTPTDLILDIRLGSLLSQDFLDTVFIPWIEQQNIGDFEWNHAREYHARYLSVQKNLQWWSSIQSMREHRLVDRFLQKNSLVQALVLDDIRQELSDIAEWRTLEFADILQELGYAVEK